MAHGEGSPRLVVRIPQPYKDALERVSAAMGGRKMSEAMRPAILEAIRHFAIRHGEPIGKEAA
jgi:hypothetical protein